MKIKKAVIPVAGYGTRFLPFTKSVPKEMLPIIDKPVIQIIVEQLVEAGISEIILVTGYSKRAIEDYFDYNSELEYLLEKKGKEKERQLIRQVSDIAKFVYVRQKEQLGNGHAILQAKEVIDNEPFVVAWGDDFIIAQPNRYKQMINAFEKCGRKTVVEVIKSDEDDEYKRRGYIDVGEAKNGLHRLRGIIEKPGSREKSPSNLANVGGFIFTPNFFRYLEKQPPGLGGEIYVSETVHTFCQSEPVYAYEIQNACYYDCGNKLGYLKTVVEFGMKNEELGGEFGEYLKNIV